MEFPDLPGRLARVRETVARHQSVAGWTHPVRIIAVTKGHGPGAVRAAAAAGLHEVGENRVQEALEKQELPRGPGRVAWHLIGTLQRNKARHAAGPLRPSSIRWTASTSAPSSTGGSAPDARQSSAGAGELLRRAAEGRGGARWAARRCSTGCGRCPRLEVIGLMTMSALTDDTRRAAPGLSPAARRCATRPSATGHRLPELSMGMSGDYPVAVEEGATMIRLGTVLFGERAG